MDIIFQTINKYGEICSYRASIETFRKDYAKKDITIPSPDTKLVAAVIKTSSGIEKHFCSDDTFQTLIDYLNDKKLLDI